MDKVTNSIDNGSDPSTPYYHGIFSPLTVYDAEKENMRSEVEFLRGVVKTLSAALLECSKPVE